MNRPLHGGSSPWSPVVIERAGGGLARIAEDPAPIRALRGLAREGAEILGSERTAIWRMGPAGMPIRCLTRFHRTSRTHEDDVEYPDELGRESWRLLERLSVLAMDDVKGGPSPTPVLRNYLQESGIRALLAIPIRHRGLLAGFLAFEELDGPRRWTPRDREQAATLAFRLERHWARFGTSVSPASSSPGVPRLPPPRRPTDARPEGEAHARPESGESLNPSAAPESELGASAGNGLGTRTAAPHDAAAAEPETGRPRDRGLELETGRATGFEESVPEPVPQSDPQSDPQPDAQSDPESELGRDPVSEPLPHPGPVREPELEREPEPQPEPQPELEAQPEPTVWTRAVEAPSSHAQSARSFGHRRELRARLQRLRTLERAGILGTRTAREVLHWMDLQQGTLDLLEAHLEAGGTAATLLGDVRDTLQRARGELEQFLAWSRFGLQRPSGLAAPAHASAVTSVDASISELNALVGGLAVRLGKLTGDRVGLVYAPSSEPVHMRAQPHLLERALEALVRNARAASLPGDRVRVAVQRGQEPGGRRVARLVVEDRGTGIAPADLPWIFEPWFTTRGDGVDGFGLPLVQAVVEGHGGWVDVTSTEGKGSRFMLNFPLHEPTADANRTPAGSDAASTEPGTPSLGLVLLVEDEPLTARLLRRALEGAGFQVMVAEGSPDGVRLVREQAPAAALLIAERVLVDGGEGVDLLREGRIAQPYLGGILLDRRLRPGSDDELVARIRTTTRIPSDVALIPAPFHPASLVAEARRLAAARPDEPAAPPGTTLH